MLYQFFLRIRSNYPHEAFYQLFLPEDTWHTVPFEGMEEWLTPDHREIEIKISAEHENLAIGFRRQRSAQGDWIVAPARVRTDQAVILTAKGSIIQVPASAVRPGDESNAEWLDNDTMRPLVTGLGSLVGGMLKLTDGLGGVPVGEIVKVIANMVWPEPSVVSLIAAAEARMRHLIHAEISGLVRALQGASMRTVRDNLMEYANAASPQERQTWLATSLHSLTTAKNLLADKTVAYVPGTVYLVMDLAALHLGLLRERVQFEAEIFGSLPVRSQENLEVLQRVLREYQDYLAHAVEKEVEERKGQISLSYANSVGLGPKGILGQALQIRVFLRDDVRRQILRFSVSGSFNSITHSEPTEQIKPVQPLIDMYMDQVENELRVRLEQDIVMGSRMLDWFDPVNRRTQPVSLDRVFTVGPVSGLTLLDFNTESIGPLKWTDGPVGTVRRVQLINVFGVALINLQIEDSHGNRSYTLDEALGGLVVGYDLELPPGVWITKVECWCDRHPRGFRLTYSDGSVSKLVGKSSGDLLHQVATLDQHELCQVGYAQEWAAFRFGFRLRRDFYSKSRS